ncbi:MAG: DUF1848 family protein [Desulfosudaceae bacterium]
MQKIILSASRRTDIPAFYMDWFMAGIDRGEFTVINPFNNQARQVPAGPDRVHTIVFWSKNFAAFLNGGYGEQLLERGYHLFFNFTVNSRNRLLEPRLPPLAERLEQMRRLSARFGPERLQWRFDPICFYTTGEGRLHDNLGDFEAIAAAASGAGVKNCVTSFVDLYRKVVRRAERLDGFSFVEPDMARRVSVVKDMAARLSAGGINLSACCEKDLLAALPPDFSARSAACIPGPDFARRDGGSISLRKDSGQRAAAGCGCTISTDIGSYRDQPCYHNCLFCYAHPSEAVPPHPEAGEQPRTSSLEYP